MWHNFKCWLIRLLGGSSEEVILGILKEGSDLSKYQSDEIGYLREELSKARAELKDLQSIINARAGFVVVGGSTEVKLQEQHKPLQSMSMPWSKRQKGLEARDRELAENAKRVKERYKGKQPEVVPGSAAPDLFED